MTAAAIVLAAGGSSRLGEPKQLLRNAQGESLVHAAAREALAAGAHPVFVIVGALADDVAAAVSDVDVIVIRNNHWQSGLASSIHAGVMATTANDSGADAILLLTCDMPAVGCEHLRKLLHEYANGAERVASAYANALGVPVLIRENEFEELLKLSGDKGAKHLFARTGTVAIPLHEGTLDIDTPADVVTWRATEA